MLLLNYNNVTVARAGRTILKEVNWQVEAGDFVYLTGDVGAGKSSLMKTIYAELDIAWGKAEVLGVDLTTIRPKDIPALRRQIGIIFQDFKLLKERTVFKNLDFVLKATGTTDKAQRKRRVEEVLAHVGMSNKMLSNLYELSGGEQQRVCLARAILNHPKIILADEALVNQDEASSIKMLTLLQEIAQQGTAVIFATHDTHLIKQFPGKVYVCNRGKFEKGQGSWDEESGTRDQGLHISADAYSDIPIAVVDKR